MGKIRNGTIRNNLDADSTNKMIEIVDLTWLGLSRTSQQAKRDKTI